MVELPISRDNVRYGRLWTNDCTSMLVKNAKLPREQTRCQTRGEPERRNPKESRHKIGKTGVPVVQKNYIRLKKFKKQEKDEDIDINLIVYLPHRIETVSDTARAEMYKENDMWRLCFCIITWKKNYKARTGLKAFCTWLMQHRWLTPNPVANWKYPVPFPKGQRSTFTSRTLSISTNTRHDCCFIHKKSDFKKAFLSFNNFRSEEEILENKGFHSQVILVKLGWVSQFDNSRLY